MSPLLASVRRSFSTLLTVRIGLGACALGWLAVTASADVSSAPPPAPVYEPLVFTYAAAPDPQAGQVAAEQRSGDNVWQFFAGRPAADAARTVNGQYAVVTFSKPAFDAALAVVARDTDPAAAGVMFTMPFPDGTFERFIVKDSPMLAPELSAAFPEIRTFSGQGVDDPTATTRFGWTATGFHAIVLSGVRGTVYIDTWAPGDTATHIVYRKSDLQKPAGETWQCFIGGEHVAAYHRSENSFPFTNGDTLRTYRLALAATGEYTAAAGGTKTLALARMTATMNRVNGIYERDLAVRMTVSTGTTGDPTALIFTDGTSDPFTNNDGVEMLEENGTAITNAGIASGDYDLGHVFSTGGGVAYLGSPCTSFKYGGVTGSSNPTGDAFDVDYVAHEIGHQFGGNHTFNGTTNSCGPSRSTSHAYEVGSGVTIQAYAGICSEENLQSNSIDRFHAESLDEMTAFLTSGAGSTCGTPTATGNTPPSVTALSAVTIPARTPFALTASATDANSDSLTYAWDQFDLGAVTNSVATASNGAVMTGPIFRPYSQSSSPTRRFPNEHYILNNANLPPSTYTGTAFTGGPSCFGTCLTGEVLPTVSRTMNFMVVVRDNRSGGGGIATQTQTVNVVDTGVPFQVTSPNTAVSLAANSQTTVTWDVAGTTANGINAATVMILLSTDGGQTFPTTLLSSTANDGSESVTLPNISTTQARILVQATSSAFFDISDTNFAITGGSGGGGTLTATPSTLRFSATKNGAGGDLVAQTGAQTVTVTYTGTPPPQWTATSNQPWAVVTNGSGTGAGTFSVSIANPSNAIAGSTNLSATIALSAPNTGASGSVAVQLTVAQQTGTTSGPTGQVDTPAQSATGLQGAIAMTGWVVDDVGIQHVRIYRQCLAFDNPAACQLVLGANLVLVGTASIIPGARPDVEALFPTLPANNSAGWGFLILSNLLPNIPATNASGGGVGTFQLSAVATDAEGNQRLLGRSYVDTTPVPTTVTIANDTIAKPFGAIDTPGQGATVSGTLNNFGWALTPDSNTVADGTDIQVPTTGATVNVFIDGVVVGQATYNLCRGSVAVGGVTPTGLLCDDDVSTIFRSAGVYRNLDAGRGPIGLRTINTAGLTNGLHTIQWGVTDSASRGEGIGSRYFTVLNSATRVPAGSGGWRQVAAGDGADAFVARRDLPRRDDVAILGRTGFNLDRAFVPIEPVGGVPSVVVPELGRVELRVPGAHGVAVVANGDLRAAPVGMAVDDVEGVVTWSVGPGYLGTYRLLVEREEDHVLVDVTVAPMAVVEEPVRMHVDQVDQFGSVFVMHGWALDPQAETGSGIGAVHVWARRKMSSEVISPAAPEITSELVFLGVADLGVSRPDVAAAHGGRFAHAGFRLESVLGAGEWEVTAYIWNVRTQRFEDARSVTVTIR